MLQKCTRAAHFIYHFKHSITNHFVHETHFYVHCLCTKRLIKTKEINLKKELNFDKHLGFCCKSSFLHEFIKTLNK